MSDTHAQGVMEMKVTSFTANGQDYPTTYTRSNADPKNTEMSHALNQGDVHLNAETNCYWVYDGEWLLQGTEYAFEHPRSKQDHTRCHTWNTQLLEWKIHHTNNSPVASHLKDFTTKLDLDLPSQIQVNGNMCRAGGTVKSVVMQIPFKDKMIWDEFCLSSKGIYEISNKGVIEHMWTIGNVIEHWAGKEYLVNATDPYLNILEIVPRLEQAWKYHSPPH
ncbi:hypothetical protein DFJ43DRAFT_1041507 [Lentinula guzmanii]|uniref:Uncharacterized protein n=1 Tax=Lentinula guzmanii TaxID=2804957 RepID=A0AA38JF12_9AGAR|nr:hypothetical protein DFJ43DRAFT_1041507 [Lentinula guzmanii]